MKKTPQIIRKIMKNRFQPFNEAGTEERSQLAPCVASRRRPSVHWAPSAWMRPGQRPSGEGVTSSVSNRHFRIVAYNVCKIVYMMNDFMNDYRIYDACPTQDLCMIIHRHDFEDAEHPSSNI